MHIWVSAHACLSLAEVSVVVAGSIEREAGSSWLGAVSCGCCASSQTAEKYQASCPPRTLQSFCLFLLSLYSISFFFLPLSNFSTYHHFFPSPETLCGSVLEQETESGSVGQLRQQAQAGSALGVTWVLLLPQSSPQYSPRLLTIDSLHNANKPNFLPIF